MRWAPRGPHSCGEPLPACKRWGWRYAVGELVHALLFLVFELPSQPPVDLTPRPQALSEEAYAAAVCTHLHDQLVQHAQRAFDERCLGPALAYSTTAPLQFLALVLPPGRRGAAALQQGRVCACVRVGMRAPPARRSRRMTHGLCTPGAQARLSYYVYETIGALRIDHMFDIVVDFPDSLPACQDAAECLRHTSLHRKFIERFGQATQDRLLHPGV